MFNNIFKFKRRPILIGTLEYEALKPIAKLHRRTQSEFATYCLNRILFPNDYHLHRAVVSEIENSINGVIENDYRQKLSPMFEYSSVRHNLLAVDIADLSEFLSSNGIPPAHVNKIKVAIAELKAVIPMDNSEAIDFGSTPEEIADFLIDFWPVFYNHKETYYLLNDLFKIPCPSKPVTLDIFMYYYAVVDERILVEMPEDLIVDTLSRLRKTVENAG